MQVIDRRALRVLMTIAAFVAVIGLIYLASPALLALIFALFFSYLLEPLVDLLQPRLRGSRGAAIALVYVAVALAVWGAATAIGPKLADQVQKVTRTAPALVQQVESGEIAQRVGGSSGWSGRAQASLQWLRPRVENWLHSGLRYLTVAASLLFWAAVVPILAIFVLKDKERWLDWLMEVPDSQSGKRRMRDAVLEIDRSLRRYVWAEMVLVLAAFFVFWIVLSLMGMASAVLLAGVQALLELVFVIGPLTAGVIIVGTALFTGNNPLAVLLFVIGWRAVQDYVNTPLLFGKRLEIHPLLVVLVLMVGWEAGKVIGMILAIPMAVSAQIVCEAWTRHRHPGKAAKHMFEEGEAA